MSHTFMALYTPVKSNIDLVLGQFIFIVCSSINMALGLLRKTHQGGSTFYSNLTSTSVNFTTFMYTHTLFDPLEMERERSGAWEGD